MGESAVSIERVFYCDAEDCETHVRTAAARPGPGWVTATEDGHSRHFCAWDCCMKFAATVPAPEIIPFNAEES